MFDMSYCVNCGVELDKSAHKCALCDTPVYNPNLQVRDKSHPFSHTPDIPSGIKQRFIAIVISFIILIPNIVCMFINLFFLQGKLWFIYVAASSFLCWILFVFPFLTKKLRPYLMWGFDTLAVALYTLVFYFNDYSSAKWYFYLAVPIIAIISACVLCFIYWYRQRKHHWTSKVLHIFIDLVICLFVASLCLFLNNFITACVITLITGTCCLALVFFWLYANRSKKVRAWLTKKLFV